jgi:3-oxoadipate enol-lactonase
MSELARAVEIDVEVEGGRLACTVEGPEDGPVLLLSNSLGTTRDLWTPQIAEFARTFRVVRYDTRGHGASLAPAGDYTLDRLGIDALAILDAVGAARAHVCGLSLGGLTALWLGIYAPERVNRMVVANSAAKIGTREKWDERVAIVQTGGGMAAVAEASLARWFTGDFVEREPATARGIQAMVAGCPPHGYIGCCGALRDADLREEIGRIAAPTLVITGVHDPVTSAADAQFLGAGIASTNVLLLDAAHLSSVEQAEAFTAAVCDFLGEP